MRFSNVRGRDVRQRQCFTSYYPSCLHPPKYYGCCRCAVVSILKVFWKQISPTLFLRIPFWIHLKFKNMFHFVSAMPTFNSCQKRFWGFERRWVTPLSTRCHRLVRYFSDLAKTELVRQTGFVRSVTYQTALRTGWETAQFTNHNRYSLFRHIYRPLKPVDSLLLRGKNQTADCGPLRRYCTDVCHKFINYNFVALSISYSFPKWLQASDLDMNTYIQEHVHMRVILNAL